MAHRTITISEDAYRALAQAKEARESFTEVILRLTARRGSATALLAYLERLPPSDELARKVEAAMTYTRKARLRTVALP